MYVISYAVCKHNIISTEEG